MNLDELRDYALLMRNSPMGFYQNAGMKTTPPSISSITRDQFNEAMARLTYGVSYSSLPKGSIDVLVDKEWPKFLAGESDYQFLAGRIDPQLANTPMSAKQTIQDPPYQPALSFRAPEISEDEMFPNPPSTEMPMSPYAQAAMDQVTGTYANQFTGIPSNQEILDMRSSTSPYAQLMTAKAMLPEFMNQYKQYASRLSTSPELEGDDGYIPRESRPDRWDRKVAREQARNAGANRLEEEYNNYLNFYDSLGVPEAGMNREGKLTFDEWYRREYPGSQQDTETAGSNELTFGEGLSMAASLFDPSRYSLEGTLYNIGRAIGDDSGNKGLRVGLGAASAALKGGRDILSGLAFSRASRDAKDWYEKQMRKIQYNPVNETAYGYTGDVAVNARGGVMRFQDGGPMEQMDQTAVKPLDFANDPRFQPGEYIEFEYGGKMYKGTIKENNGKTISLK